MYEMYGEIEGRNWRYGPKSKWDEEVKDAQRERGVETPFRSPQLGQDGNALRLPHHLHDRRSPDKVGA